MTRNEQRLRAIDPEAAIRRQACERCGVHMIGTVADPDHHFYGVCFVHPERDVGYRGWPEFAGFVSSLIEGGLPPERTTAVRTRLAELGIDASDAFSPEIMDLIAWHRVKLSRPSRRPAVLPVPQAQLARELSQ